ncbi:hypothetical protein [Candidatus Coxiella mudrowiae]|uniref:hypothetical protein n=1 Tax=Candidatus Coxiella mudrowiae TaxID=2054173 RepID=UPI0006620A33|nr:hypothetical protein [Candidatus Coxiella mudrowiae]
METWQLQYRYFIAPQQHFRETLCTLGNGYFSTRGAWEEVQYDRVHYTETYISGYYNRLTI